MIIGEATDFPGPPAADPTVRAALVVLFNNLADGRTGVRPELVKRLLQVYAAAHMPTVREDTSFGTADLTRFDLAPKESVSLIDNNSFALGSGALVLAEAERLLIAFDLAAATALEAIRGEGQARSRKNLLRFLAGSDTKHGTCLEIAIAALHGFACRSRKPKNLLDRAWETVALEMAIAVWAITRRGLEVTQLGAGPRQVVDSLSPRFATAS
jgi:hypothetical protein